MYAPSKILALCHPKEIKLYTLFGFNITGDLTADPMAHSYIKDKAHNEKDKIELIKAYEALCNPITENIYRCYGQDGLNSKLISIKIDWTVIDKYVIEYKTSLKSGFERQSNIIFSVTENNLNFWTNNNSRNETTSAESINLENDSNNSLVSTMTTNSSFETKDSDHSSSFKSQSRSRIRENFWLDMDYTGTNKPIRMIKFSYDKRERIARAIILWDNGDNTQIEMEKMLTEDKIELLKKWLEQCKRWQKKEFERYCPKIYDSLSSQNVIIKAE